MLSHEGGEERAPSARSVDEAVREHVPLIFVCARISAWYAWYTLDPLCHAACVCALRERCESSEILVERGGERENQREREKIAR